MIREGSKSDFDTNKCKCEELDLEVDIKGKECQNLKDEITKITMELENLQEELKIRVKYGGNTEAFNKILRKS